MFALYFRRCLTAASQFFNTVFLGGDPDETASGRAYRNRHMFGWQQLAWALDRLEQGHTEDAYEPDEGGEQVLPDWIAGYLLVGYVAAVFIILFSIVSGVF